MRSDHLGIIVFFVILVVFALLFAASQAQKQAAAVQVTPYSAEALFKSLDNMRSNNGYLDVEIDGRPVEIVFDRVKGIITLTDLRR